MTRHEISTMLKLTSALLVCSVIVIGCATNKLQDPAAAPEPASPEADGKVREIVVTASRAHSSDRRRRNERGTAAAMSPGAFDASTHGGRAELKPLSSDEELWVIATPASDNTHSVTDDGPRSGAMVAHFPGETDDTTNARREVPLPLQHTAVNARVDGYVSTVNVRQQFANPFDQKIEAVYLFPLPEKAAVNEFLMIIGERKIRGILREKKEAEAIYREARSRGYQASLLVQHRPNVFEQKVANIEPGHSIDVDIRYFHTLAYEDGWYSFVFPTVVGPRYNPPGHGDKGVSVSYLRPDERSGHDISISVDIDAGVAIEELKSTHAIVESRRAPELATVELAGRSAIPNRDFVLKFRVAGGTVKSTLMTYRNEATNQGYFTLMLYPPTDVTSLERRAMEMVFVLDCSGSMNGRPLRQAKNAVRAALGHLREGDTFQIIRFSEDSTQLGSVPLAATTENLKRATRYLDSLHGTGGTQMIEGVKAALDFPHDPARLRFVTFMTDGYIGNETDIIGAVHDRIGASRIFSFGVGNSVNRYLLERMAREGRGAVAYLGLQDSATEIMNDFFARISHPAMTDVDVDWAGMAVSDVYPARIPDLFVGRAVVVTGKYLGEASDIRVRGTVGSAETSLTIASVETDESRASISKLWARLRIADLADRQAFEADPYDELADAIRDTALEHQLVSDYTSFVAVDASRRTEGEFGVTVPQAVPVPDGVRYETTVDKQ